jgi:dienelactone hydrolase
MRFDLRHWLAATALVAVFAGAFSDALADRLEMSLGTENGTRTIIFTPDGAQAKRAVLLLSGSGDVGQREFRPAENFAKRGVLAVVPYYLERHSEALGAESTIYLRNNERKRQTVEADLLAIMDQVSERFGFPRQAFIAQGFSMGGSFIRDMAAQSQICAGAIVSDAWINGEDDAVRLRSIVSGSSSPILILAGTNDELIRFNSSMSPTNVEAIFRDAGARVTAHYFKGGDHSLKDHGQQVARLIRTFFQNQVSRSPGPGGEANADEMVGPRGLTARQMIAKVDGDGDGKIARSEFAGANRVFVHFDVDGDGFLTVEEFETRWV